MRTAISSINQAARQKRLGEKLRQARRDCGLNQEDVGLILNLSVLSSTGGYQSNLSRVENGRRKINVFELEEFARLYHKPLEFFATWEEDDEKQLRSELEQRACILKASARKPIAGEEPDPQRPATLRKRRERILACLAGLKDDKAQKLINGR